MERVGFLTSGGDCQALNVTMRGVAKALYEKKPDIDIYGIQDGYRGLIYGNYEKLTPRDFTGLLTRGGTFIGTSRVPFKTIEEPDENGLDKIKAMISNYKKLKLDCLVVLGGNGSQKTANLLSEKGLNVVSLPKTIDNDIWGTDMTFGFQSAVDIATEVIDSIHTTADSHGRIFIIEIMGHKAGWLALNAGMAGGADIVLIPEIPFSLKKVASAIEKRVEEGKRFSILAVAEGAISKEDAALSKKELKQKKKDNRFPSISYEIGQKLEEMTGQEIRITVPGHMQRGGSPCPYDRVLSSRLGAAAAELIMEEKFGYMVAVKQREIVPVPLKEVAGKLKTVAPDAKIIQEAKSLGICFGD